MLPYSFAHRVMVSHGAPSASFSAGPSTGQPPLKATIEIKTKSAQKKPGVGGVALIVY